MATRFRFFEVLFALVMGAALTACSNVGQIRKQLLEKTPIGSDMAKVLMFCALEKLKCNRSDTAGYLDQDTGKGVGVKSIWGVLTERKTTPLTITTVEVYWGFDNDGRLIDIWVWKTTDAP